LAVSVLAYNAVTNDAWCIAAEAIGKPCTHLSVVFQSRPRLYSSRTSKITKQRWISVTAIQRSRPSRRLSLFKGETDICIV